MFDVQVGSSAVLRGGGHSLPGTPKMRTLAAVKLVASLLLRRDVFERFELAEGHHLRRIHGAKVQPQTLAR